MTPRRILANRRGSHVVAPDQRLVSPSGQCRLAPCSTYAAVILGPSAVFGVWELVVWAAIVLVAFHLFVVIYEEPTLERIFGEDYEAYRRDVGRWVPRRLGVVVPRRDDRA